MGALDLLAVLLAVLFIGLKLAGFIAWTWLWVLSPLWIWFGLIVLLFLLMVVFD